MATATSQTKKTKRTADMANSAFHKFFLDELKDIYWAEKHLVKSLPKMQKASTSPELGKAFEKHIKETEEHVTRLEKAFELLGEKAVGKKCDAMVGLVDEAKGVIEDTEKSTMVRDAGLILAAQKAEHYEIATYGTLVVFAKQMGHTKVADLLSKTLENEKQTDMDLTKIAEAHINEEAAEE